MENKENSSYKAVKTITEKKSSKVFTPFISGILGAGLTLGVCFGVPEIKTKLFTLNGTIQPNNTRPIISSTNNQVQSSTTNFTYEDLGPTIANKVLPSVVGIEVEYTVNSIFGTQGLSKASGSGIIISSDGYILTNNHVVSNSSSTSDSTMSSFYQVSEANSIKVFLYGDEKTSYDAKIIGTDSETDLAVIKIDASNLNAAELGNSDELKIGEWAMAIGNPLGLSSSVSIGAISGSNRQVTDSDGQKYTLIQTDAAINSGNSGGALVNSKGQVVGINFMKISSVDVEGISFAIPITPAIEVSNQLIQYNKVKRPYLGITGATVTEQISKKYNLAIGAYVQSIDSFTNAASCGLKAGDVIIAIDNTKITSMTELSEYVKTKNINDQVTLKINRAGEELELTCTLSEQP